jgi:hypothetical protein
LERRRSGTTFEMGETMAKKTVTNYRDAKSGEFVTKKYVEKHKSTTTTEHNPRGPRKPTKKK